MLALLITLADEKPADEDVVAGPLGAALFAFLIICVVILAFSLVKQLRKAQSAKDAGVYGDEPVSRDSTDPETPDDDAPSR